MNAISLFKGFEYEIVQGSIDKEITALVRDNREVVKDCAFVCIGGANFDTHDKVSEIADAGASIIVVMKELPADFYEAHSDVTVVSVKDTRFALAFMSAAFFGHPADKMKVIGITGTKGKTTTTYLIKAVLEKAGFKVGLVGTIETIIGDEHIPAKNTTPESYVLQETFAKMVEEKCDICVMEASSQGFLQHRTQGFIFDIGVFTNIEPDHIGPNEHKDFEDYLYCKSLLFRQCRYGIFNADDKHVSDMMKDATCECVTFSSQGKADYMAENTELINGEGFLGVSFDVKGKRDISVTLHSPGRFSVSNALAAIAVCDRFRIDTDVIKDALLSAKVKGRIEMVKVSDDFTLMIDYAHNAMALESLLKTLKEYEPGRLISLFGCGGNRSKLRRYDMGQVSGELADLTIITSDNPRTEKPSDIINDIIVGMDKTKGAYITIEDRREAIAYAIKTGRKGDVIVLAGKGHEDYQEINGVKYPMDERDIIEDVLSGRQEPPSDYESIRESYGKGT